MKSITYNMRKGALAVIMVLIFINISNASPKGIETPTSNPVNSHLVIKINSAEAEIEAKIDALTETIQDWMNDGSYWEAESSNEISNSNLTAEIKKWKSNVSCWNGTSGDEKAEINLSSKLKSLMTSGSYWEAQISK